MAFQDNITSTKADWYENSGFSETLPATVNGYAQRLVRYIADASTVRIRVLDQFGSAPPIEKIRRWRAEWVAQVESRAGPPRANDDDDDWPVLDAPRPDRPDPAVAVLQALGRHGVVRLGNVTPAICAAVVARVIEAQRGEAGETPSNSGVTVARIGRTGSIAVMIEPAYTAREVMARCAAWCDVADDDLTGPSRVRGLIRARQLTAAVLRARRNSYPQIGRWMNRDHSSVIHAVNGFFAGGLADADLMAGWLRLAPCMAKAARSARELDVITGMVALPPGEGARQ